MKKWIVLGLLILRFTGCARQVLTTAEIDELFGTDFESSGLYRGEDKFPLGHEPVYRLKGYFSAIDNSMTASISKEDNVNLMTQSLGLEVKAEEVFLVDDVEVKVKLIRNRLIECKENFYVPYYIVELKTDQGYFGFRINSKDSNTYSESQRLKESDREFITKMIGEVFNLYNE